MHEMCGALAGMTVLGASVWVGWGLWRQQLSRGPVAECGSGPDGIVRWCWLDRGAIIDWLSVVSDTCRDLSSNQLTEVPSDIFDSLTATIFL